MENPKGDPKSVDGGHRRFIIPSQDAEGAPVRPLFKAPAAAPSCPGPSESYADYIFQKTSKAPQGKPQGQRSDLGYGEKPPSEKLYLDHELNVKYEKKKEGPESKCGAPGPDLGDKEELQTVTTSTGQAAIPVLKSGAGRSCIVVSPRQRGNPLLKHVRNIPWEFGEIVPDYLLGDACCALFLSLRYHNLNPEYIHARLRSLGHTYALRVLLVQVDVKDPHYTLKELAKICVLSDCTLVLSWSAEEAARYLETYKCYEQKPADVLKEKTESDFMSRVTDCLTTVKSVNKTDSCTLLTTFGTLADLANASREDLSLCPGLGPQKAKRLFDALHEPFLNTKK